MEWSELNRVQKIGLFLSGAILISFFLLWVFEERFDQDKWYTEPSMRYKMVDNLIERRLLMNKTKEETITVLGKPNSVLNLEKEIFLYDIGDPPSFFNSKKEQLLVAFEDGKVIKVALTED